MSPKILLPMLLVLGVLIYSNTFDAPFLYDDTLHIVSNENIHIDSFSLGRILQSYYPEYPFDRPVAYMSFALNYYFGGLDVFGYHLVNIIIHILTGIGVYLLVKATLGINSCRGAWPCTHTGFSGEGKRNAVIAALAAALWLTSPVQTQAVTYIVQRMTSMAALFYIYSLLFYIKGRTVMCAGRIAYFSLSVFLFLLSIGTKQNSLTLPIVLVLYEFCFFRGDVVYRKGMKWIFFSLFLIILLGAGFLFFSPYLEPAKYFSMGYAMRERIFTEARVIVHYAALMLLPIPSKLVFLYDFPFSRGILSPPSTIIALIMVIGGTLASILMVKRYTAISFFLLWFFVNIFPESLYLNIEPVFEHRLYLPSVGFYAIAAYLIVKCSGFVSAEAKGVLIGTILILLLLFSINTYHRNMVWNDEIAFWTDNVKKSPRIPDPHEGLGMAYVSAGRLDEADKELNVAKGLDPLSRASLGLGVAYFKKGDYIRAIEELEYVAKRGGLGVGLHYHDTEGVFYSIGIGFLKIGRHQDAERVFRMGLTLNPENAKIRDALAMIERGA